MRERWGVGEQVNGLSVPWILPPPVLPTLEGLPSWVNAYGNVDRSACVGVWVSELRRLHGCVRGSVRPDPETGRRIRVRPLPTEEGARNGLGRLTTARVVLTKAMLEELLARRPERLYPGDYRTLRSPAMRGALWQAPPAGARQPSSPGVRGWKGFRWRVGRGGVLRRPEEGLEPNPNAGPGRGKGLGVGPPWQVGIRLERWQMGGLRSAYYMICPAGGAGLQDPGDGQYARLSSAPRGAAPWGRCPQRVLSLLMVLCTPQEAVDAALAQAWIGRLPAEPGPRTRQRWNEVVAVVNRLCARYGMLFAPRRLVCRQCLGVRYADLPEAARRAGGVARGRGGGELARAE